MAGRLALKDDFHTHEKLRISTWSNPTLVVDILDQLSDLWRACPMVPKCLNPTISGRKVSMGHIH